MSHFVARTASRTMLFLLATVFGASAQQGRSYHDPAGRFTLSVPAGWSAQAANNGVVVSRGTALAMVSPFTGAQSPREVVELLARQYGSQWKGLQQIAQGDFDLNGSPASYGMFTGTSPRGIPSLLRLVGVMPNGGPFALIISVPKEQFRDLTPTLQGMEGSIQFGGDRGAAPMRGQQNQQQNQQQYQPQNQQQYEQQNPQQYQQQNQQQNPQQYQPQDGEPPSRASQSSFSGRGGAPSVPGKYYRMRWVRVMDQYGFGQPTEVLRLLVPADWKMEGGVTWAGAGATGCTANGIRFQARAVSPDGASSLEFFTPYTWQWNDDPMSQQQQRMAEQSQSPAMRPCAMRPIVGAQEYLRQAVVPNYRRGARIVNGSPMPQVAQAQNAMLRSQLASQFQAGLVSGTKVDAGRVMLSYQMNGRPVEEAITAVVNVVARPTYSPSAAMQGGMAKVNSYSIVASQLIAMRAPAGELESQSRLYATMIASIRPNMRWVNAVQQVQLNIGNAQLQGAIDRSHIYTEAGHATDAIITSAYREQQAVQDRLADQFSQSQRGVEHFVDPTSNERVELSAGYRQAWSNGNGEYILSDDVNFDPSVALHGNWRQMDHTNQ